MTVILLMLNGLQIIGGVQEEVVKRRTIEMHKIGTSYRGTDKLILKPIQIRTIL